MPGNCNLKTLTKLFDHSVLHPTATDEAAEAGCELAKRLGTASACVKPTAVAIARRILEGSGVGVCTVIAFPHGNSTTAIKTAEAIAAVKDGANEIDMVVNLGKVFSGQWDYVSQEIGAINEAVVSRGGLLKVIFENDFLHDDQIVKL